MTTVEEEGRTPEEAIEAGLRRLELEREYVLVEVLEEGMRGFLGLGGRRARVRLSVTPMGEQIFKSRAILTGLLKRMGANVAVTVRDAGGLLSAEIRGEDAGLLIGRQGQTLESISFLAGLILSRQLGERVRLEIDIEGYRERRRKLLEEMAVRLAEQVKSTGEAVTLEPMSPADRRTIHLTLQQDRRVRTVSEGEGAKRRLVIAPVNG